MSLDVVLYGSHVPDITVRYCEIVREIESWGKLYGLDKIREEAHDELCKKYGLTKEATKKVTGHLDKYPDFVDVHFALLALQEPTP